MHNEHISYNLVYRFQSAFKLPCKSIYNLPKTRWNSCKLTQKSPFDCKTRWSFWGRIWFFQGIHAFFAVDYSDSCCRTSRVISLLLHIWRLDNLMWNIWAVSWDLYALTSLYTHIYIYTCINSLCDWLRLKNWYYLTNYPFYPGVMLCYNP